MHWLPLLVGLAIPLVVFLWKASPLLYHVFRLKKMMVESEFEIVSGPDGPPAWRQPLWKWERELTAIGYERFLHYRNATLAEAGQPNFYSVFVSPDRTVIVELWFSLWPGGCNCDLAQLTEENGVTRSSANAISWLGDPEGLITKAQEDEPLADVVTRHRRALEERSTLEQPPTLFDSPARFMEFVAGQHVVIASKLKQNWF